MIRIEGTLVVRKIPSRNGPFAVADLVTDVAEFKVKDTMLDQFEAGEYRGTFHIAEIYLAGYQSFGRSVTELRARLQDLRINSQRAIEPGAGGGDEIDPIDEVRPAKVRATHPKLSVPPKDKAGKPVKDTASAKPKTPSRSSGEAQDAAARAADLELFGADIHALVVAGQSLKLDPNIDDRARFRSQIQRLGQLGYAFKSNEQTWYPKA